MKTKLFILGLFIGSIILNGCNDTLTQVGTGIQPETDRPTVSVDTFYMQARTVQTDSIYARTIYGALGEIYDPLYGNLKSDFMCQFYCPENFRFLHTPYNGKIDSVEFRFLYSRTWTGDSLTPMQVQLYEVTELLPRDFYTSFDPLEYCDMQKPIGTQSYTARNLAISDSLWNAVVQNSSGTSSSYSYTPTITVRMPVEIGERFYNATINTPEVFNSQETFNEFFPGVYVTNSYGTGNIINIDNSQMLIYYKYAIEGSAGQDSLIQTAEIFSATSEVVQLNRFENTDIDHLLEPNDSIAYLKSPAGVYTELTIPAQEIAPIIEGRIVSNFDLTLRALPQENWKYAFEAPTYLLVLPHDSVDAFFRNNNTEDSRISYLGTYDTDTRTYAFGNIARLLEAHIQNSPDKDIRLDVFPVERRVGQQSNYWGQTSSYTMAIENYMQPSGVKLRIDEEARAVQIVTIEYAQ